MPALLLPMLTHLFLSSSLSLFYFILAVPMRKCLGKHSCVSSSFPIAILNDTSFFPVVQLQVHNENPGLYGRNTDAIVNLNTMLNCRRAPKKLTLLDWENALAQLSGQTCTPLQTLKIIICCIEKMRFYDYHVKLGELVCCFLDRRSPKLLTPLSSQLRNSTAPRLCAQQSSPLWTPPAPRLSDHHRSELKPTAQRSLPIWTPPAPGLCDHRSPPVEIMNYTNNI